MSEHISTALCTPPTIRQAIWLICRWTISSTKPSSSTFQSICTIGRSLPPRSSRAPAPIFVKGAASAGSGAVLLLPPRAQSGYVALDAEEEDQMVGHGHRFMRPLHEYVDQV